MKRKIFLFILLLLATTVLTAAAAETVIIPVRQVPEDSLAFTREEALAKATELFSEHGGTYSGEQYYRKAGSVLLPDGQTAWIVFIERHAEEAAGNLYAVLSAENGEIIEIQYPDNDVYTWVMLQWINAKNQYRSDWPVEEQALFDWLFSDSDELFEPSLAAVSSEEAVRIASEWAREYSGAAYDDATVSYAGFSDDRHMWYCWIVSFEQNGNQVLIVYVNTENGEVENSYDPEEGVG